VGADRARRLLPRRATVGVIHREGAKRLRPPHPPQAEWMIIESRDNPSRVRSTALRLARTVVGDALRDAWALIMPVDCAGCDALDRALCIDCAGALTAETTLHSTPRHLPVFAALRYEGTVRRIVLAFKNQQRTDLARPLARSLIPALHAALVHVRAQEELAEGQAATAVQIAAVPSSRSAFRSRGYHPVAVALRAAGVYESRVLRVARATGSQKTLSATERARNAEGAFVATRWLGGARFIVVDDVLTTGATIDEATRAIAEAGGIVIAAATIGFTPRRLPVRDFVSIEG